MRLIISAATIATVSACASTSVTPVSRNEFLLNTSAAPVCGTSGAAKVASEMAAIETLKAGYDGYRIRGAHSDNNVQVVQTAPTGASTTSSYNVSGNGLSGQANTTFTGGGTIITGGYDQSIAVRMYKRSEAGYERAIDARKALGENWEEAVQNGVSTCT
ncbi:hypothetical protein [Roseovarius aquimarinus]|uniref:Lipoprotein n=1 Tax=Roseovarius aquimarinus TaxID=1229156 RepID=A0ABW7I6U7_9RHOB